MKDERDIKELTHEELVQEVHRMAHQLSCAEQQRIKDKIEAERMKSAH